MPDPTRTAFWLGLVATLAIGATLLVVTHPLTTEGVPYGILSLEFAWTADRARAIADRWTEVGALPAARAGQVLDTVFPLAYGTLGAATALLWGRQLRRSAAGMFALAAVLDLTLENLVYDVVLWGGQVSDTAVHVATLAAAAKFGLLAAAPVVAWWRLTPTRS